MNTDIEIWDQNKKRLFEFPKVEYTKRSINSLIRSIKFCEDKYPNIKIKTIIIDDNSSNKNMFQIKKIITREDIEILSLNYSKLNSLCKNLIAFFICF